jgi:thiol-disulfide isomerase/thioredoxin
MEASMKAAPDAPIRTSATVLDRILTTGRPTLIVFETPGCEPCEALRPTLDRLACEFRHRLLVVRVTDSAEGWLAARYHLSFVPTLLFWRGGAEQCRIKGNPGHAAVRAHVEFLLTGECPPDPAEGPRHTLEARFGGGARRVEPRALLFAGA